MSTTDSGAARQTAPGADTAWMSWLRVVSICAVVSLHTTGYNAVMPEAREIFRGQLAIVLNRGALFAVPVFVMLSGALMLDPARYRGPADFLRKRAGRLLPPIIVWHLWYVALIVTVQDQDLSVHDALMRTLNGNLYTALYFFWIVLGLSVVAPVLIPFIRDNGRRGALIAGAVATTIPVLTMATIELRGTGLVFADTAFTWWFPYVGIFLLGYGLRGVVLRGPALALVTAGAAGIAALNSWQWRNPDAPNWLQTITPVGYFSATGVAFACCVFLAFQGLLAPNGPLRFATGPRSVRIGRLFGDATLGVFALHLTVLYFVQKADIGGPDLASPTAHDLVLRLSVVLLVTWAIVLPLRRVPVVRALL